MNVTVVIPAHENGRWISDAVQSALDQGAPSPAVVVVNDGSTDDTAAQLAAFGDAITVLHHSEPLGSNASRNHGLEAVETEWVQFLDGDDALLPEKITTQLRVGETYEADAVYGPLRERLHATDPDAPPQEIDHVPTDPTDPALNWIRWQFAQTGTVLWRTATLRRLGGWNEEQPCCQDNEVCLRALLQDCRIAYSPHVGAVYRVWTCNSLSRKDPLRVFRERTRLTDRFLKEWQERGRLHEVHREAAGQAAFETARQWAVQDVHGALAYARERQQKGLWKIRGPAAEGPYGVLARIAGFGFAERLAAWKRRTPNTQP